MPGPRFASSAVAVAVGLLLAAAAAQAQAPKSDPFPGLARANLQRHDLDIPGHEAIQIRVDFPPGSNAPKHIHPGEEIVYVLKGSLRYDLEGRPPVTLNAGDVLFVPTGTAHSVTNVGAGSASELATYVVEKGKPLVTLVK